MFATEQTQSDNINLIQMFVYSVILPCVKYMFAKETHRSDPRFTWLQKKDKERITDASKVKEKNLKKVAGRKCWRDFCHCALVH